MPHCGYCGTGILFGGKRDGDVRYCNERCQSWGHLLRFSYRRLPNSLVQQHIWDVHQGKCPSCSGPGPVDVHTSYSVWSALVLTHWASTPRMSCKRCGIRACLKDAGFSIVLGWWGFPWGLVYTPIQVFRNVAAITWRHLDDAKPSPLLEKLVRVNLARQVLATQPNAAAADSNLR